MANDDIASMTDDELMEAWTKLGSEAQALKERLSAFSVEHQARSYQRQVAQQFGDLTPEQKEAAIRAIQSAPSPIESEEAVGAEEPVADQEGSA